MLMIRDPQELLPAGEGVGGRKCTQDGTARG